MTTKLKQTIRYLLPLSFLLSVLMCNYIYVYINGGSGMDRPLHLMELPLDRMIPFVPAFIIPYMIWSPFIFASFIYFFFRNRSSYYKMIITSVVGHLVAYSFYILYQTTVPRPIIGDDTLLLRLVHYVYSNDEPVNCFPSIHVFTTYLMMRAYAKEKNLSKVWQVIVQTIGISIILSTVFVKQHVVIDIVGGILLSEVLVTVAYQTVWRRSLVPSTSQRQAVRSMQ